MKPDELYFKRYQRDDIFLFARLMKDLQPPISEVVNCLNDIPVIEHREYQDTPGDRIEYNAFFEAWQEITQEQYKREFDKATSGEFRVFINGKNQTPEPF